MWYKHLVGCSVRMTHHNSCFAHKTKGRVDQCLFLQKLFSPQILKHMFNVFKARQKHQLWYWKKHTYIMPQMPLQVWRHNETSIAILYLLRNLNTAFSLTPKMLQINIKTGRLVQEIFEFININEPTEVQTTALSHTLSLAFEPSVQVR